MRTSVRWVSPKSIGCRIMAMLGAALVLLGAPATLGTAAVPSRPHLPAEKPDASSGGTDVFDVGRLAWRHVSTQDSRLQEGVLTICIDRKGYLWLGCPDGAIYYNGRTWTMVDLPNQAEGPRVRDLVTSADGGLWIATDGGGVHYLKDGMWTTYSVANGTLPSNTVTQVLETVADDGTLSVYFATDNGIVRYEHGVWTQFADAPEAVQSRVRCLVQSIAADGSPGLWVGSVNGLARLERGQWTIYGKDSEFPIGSVDCLLETTDKDGTPVLWIGTDQEGLVRLKDGHWSSVDPIHGQGSLNINCLLETTDATGERTLWVGTRADGLLRYQRGTWTNLTMTCGLPTNAIRSLFGTLDANGIQTLWVGTRSGDLVALRLGAWMTLDTTSGLVDNSILTLRATTAPDGSFALLAGTSTGGLARYEHGVWTSSDVASGMPDNSVYTILDTQGDDGGQVVWVGTLIGGLGRMEHGTWTTINATSGLPSNYVRRLLETTDSDGGRSLWAATNGGLGRLKNGQWTIYDTTSGLPSNRVRDLLESRGPDGARTLWVATEGGLCRYEHDRWTVFTTESGLPSNLVARLLEGVSPDGKRMLWVGTLHAGVARLDLDHPGLGLVPLRVSLPSDDIKALCEDAAGRIYLCTGQGIVQLTPRRLTPDNPAEFDTYTFTNGDGLPSNSILGNAAIVDGQGRVWVGTNLGIGVLDPSRFLEDHAPKPLYVERVLLNDRPLQYKHSEQQCATTVDLEDLSLGYDENNIAFEYALLSYYKEDETRYRTQLIGNDTAPSDWSPEFKRVYTNLAAGEYRFMVWGADYSGNITTISTATFTIRPSPWRTWWAYLIYALTIGLVGYGIVRLRLQSLERRNLVLEETIAKRTADLAASELEARTAKELALENERRAHESERVALEANQAKSVFLANMSHELRTPLNAVIGFTQLMNRDQRISVDQRENLEIIRRSGEHLLGLINDVLSISKIDTGQFTLVAYPFDLLLMLTSVSAMIRVQAEAKGLDLVVDFAPTLPTVVHGDEGKLRQVLLNLLGNAVKFTESGGVLLRARCDGDRVYFDVEDTGVGISQNEIGKLFEAFVQTESGRKAKEGTGLGLVNSRQIVGLMGGDISIRSEPGRGTTFSFDVILPLANDDDVVAERREVVGFVYPDGSSTPAPRILVVDDTPENRTLLSKLTSIVGFEVREAVNGAQAVEIWEQWQPNLIFMDIRMPVVDGKQAARRIRELEAHGNGGQRTAIMALTASAFEHEREEILSCGADDFVTKPFREVTIFDRIAGCLGVRLLYEELTPNPSSGKGGRAVLTANRIGALPPR